jgi:hypothetical protein
LGKSYHFETVVLDKYLRSFLVRFHNNDFDDNDDNAADDDDDDHVLNILNETGPPNQGEKNRGDLSPSLVD